MPYLTEDEINSIKDKINVARSASDFKQIIQELSLYSPNIDLYNLVKEVDERQKYILPAGEATLDIDLLDSLRRAETATALHVDSIKTYRTNFFDYQTHLFDLSERIVAVKNSEAFDLYLTIYREAIYGSLAQFHPKLFERPPLCMRIAEEENIAQVENFTL